MKFYDKNGIEHSYNITKDNYFDSGTQAKIYRISNNECLKVLNDEPDNYFNEEVYNEIKNLSLDGIVKLNIPFYTNGKIKAYTMEYLEKSSKSVLDMPTEYTLDNLNRLYKDILILTKRLIAIRDLYHRNLVVGPSKITIIDIDSYKKLAIDDDLLYQNTRYLLYAFKRLYESELGNKGIDINNKMISGMTVGNYTSYLFDYYGYKEEPSKVLQRRLIGTKTPMELFDRKW